MGWVGSVFLGILTAVVGAILAGFVANSAVGWYRVSSFEGGAGYFVVAMGLLGAIGGLIVGIATSRILAAGHPGGFKALGLALAVTSGVILLIGLVARLLADVPPRLDGEELLLAVELRWPEGRSLEPAPAGQWWLSLGSSSGGTRRASREGPLWREDARLEDGRWIVPGAVEVFTSRGQRVLQVEPDGILDHGFQVPLPARPGRRQLEWSEWLPRPRPGDAPLPDGFRYRFRVVPVSQPIRTEAFGPFEVATLASGFWKVTADSGSTTWAAGARFALRHRGEPIRFNPSDGTGPLDRVDAVAALHGPRPALLARLSEDGQCYLVATDEDRLRVEPIAPCGDPIVPVPLTSDPAAFARTRDRALLAGRFDRVAFSHADQFLFPGAVLDARDGSVRRFGQGPQAQVIERIPPLELAPDGRSFVRLSFSDDPAGVALAVIVPESDSSYPVPIDRAGTRYWDMDQLDPAWVRHYFAWQPSPPGPHRLVPRQGVAPLPFQGRLSQERDDREYRIGPATEALRSALVEFLVAEFGATVVSAETGAFAHEVRVEGAPVHVSFSAEDGHVGVWMDRGTDTRLVATIAERFDAALRSGRYDPLFATAP